MIRVTDTGSGDSLEMLPAMAAMRLLTIWAGWPQIGVVYESPTFISTGRTTHGAQRLELAGPIEEMEFILRASECYQRNSMHSIAERWQGADRVRIALLTSRGLTQAVHHKRATAKRMDDTYVLSDDDFLKWISPPLTEPPPSAA